MCILEAVKPVKILFCIILIAVFSSTKLAAQTCELQVLPDTMTLHGTGKTLEGQRVSVPLKKGGEITLFLSGEGKVYLRFLVNENFYFDKTDILEIRSGSKSYYAKNVKQFKVDKTTGLFVFEIYTNYLTTLKEEGITAIDFSKAETNFTRKDAADVRKAAYCIYELLVKK